MQVEQNIIGKMRSIFLMIPMFYIYRIHRNMTFPVIIVKTVAVAGTGDVEQLKLSQNVLHEY